jgi:beta-lactamase regulating signal transducer with metallopeptidase domain
MNAIHDFLNLTWDWILSATVRASLLATAVLLLRALFQRHLPARWRYALWLPVLVVLLLPVIPSRPAWMTVSPSASPVQTTMRANPVAPAEAAANTGIPSITGSSTPGKLHWLPVSWVTVTLLILGTGLVSHTRNLRRISEKSRAASPGLTLAVAAAATQAGLAFPPRLLLSSAVDGPAVTGVFRPTLLLPASFPDGFSTEEARLVLLHECLHVKRLDLPLNWLICTLQALHWFNPILWFAFSRLRADREMACDSAVLSISSPDCRADYGHALLKLQTAASSPSLHLGLVGAFNSRRDLAIRIREISLHRRQGPLCAILGALLLASLVVAGTTRAAEKNPANTPDPAVTENGNEKNVAKDSKAALEAKLDLIVLPELSFTNTPMGEVINFLRLSSVKLDPHKDVPPNGVNFVLRHHPMPDGTVFSPRKIPITYHKRDVTMRQALEDIARMTNLTMTVDEYSVTFEKAGLPKPPMPMIVVKPRTLNHLPGKAAKNAGKIIIPLVNLDHTLASAVELLNNEANKHAGTIKPPLITLHPKANGEMPIKELKLNNVPLDVAVIYLSDLSRCNILADDKEIRLVPGNLRNP